MLSMEVTVNHMTGTVIKYSILSRYLKVSNFSRTLFHAQNSVVSSTWELVAARCRCFHSDPLFHIVVTRCLSDIFYWGIFKIHWFHQGWGQGPLLRTTIVSSK